MNLPFELKDSDKYSVKCPICAEYRKKSNTKSLMVYRDADGYIRYQCQHPGCEWNERQFVKDPNPMTTAKRSEDIVVGQDIQQVDAIDGYPVWWYCDEAGLPLFGCLRKDFDGRKLYLPVRINADKSLTYHNTTWPDNKVLFNMQHLKDHSTVIVVEGEKAAKAGQAIFSKAAVVSWRGGAMNLSNGAWDLLKGKEVILWPDNDEPGKAAMSKIGDLLPNISYKIAKVDHLPPKSDLADGLTKEQITEAITQAQVVDKLGLGRMDFEDLKAQNEFLNKRLTTGIEILDDNVKLPMSGVVVLEGRTKHGKGQPWTAKILTPSGYKQLKDLSVGDDLVSVDGKESKVEGIYPHINRDTYRVTFNDGTYADVWDDHLWEVSTNHGVASVVSTLDLKKIIDKGYRRYIPNHTGDWGNAVSLPIPPYVLGVLLGDGSLKQGTRFTNSDPEVVSRVAEEIGDIYSLYSRGISHGISTKAGTENPYWTYIKEAGLNVRSDSKHIPELYMTASKESRTALLQGLMDTDGSKETSHGYVRATYSSSSKDLIKDVSELARGLGYFVNRIRVCKTTHLDSYQIVISGSDLSKVFSLPRKRIEGKRKDKKRKVVSVEFIGVNNGACIKVSHNRELYVTNDHIVTHNTQAAVYLTNSMLLTQGKTVAYFSYEIPASRVISRYARCSNPEISMEEVYNSPEMERLKPLINKKLIVYDQSAQLDLDKLLLVLDDPRWHDSVVVLDYIQIIPLRGSDRYLAIKNAMDKLRVLANKHGFVILALSQLTPNMGNPMKDTPREAQDIHFSAEAVIRLWYKDHESTHPMYQFSEGNYAMHVLLNRDGEAGHMIGFEFIKGAAYIPRGVTTKFQKTQSEREEMTAGDVKKLVKALEGLSQAMLINNGGI